jgi:hypothetical protein
VLQRVARSILVAMVLMGRAGSADASSASIIFASISCWHRSARLARPG